MPLDSVVRHDRNVLTVGTFDGVHLGHVRLVERLLELAASSGAMSTVVTFDPHPREIIHPDGHRIELLTPPEERASLLSGLGVDQLIVIPFDRDFSLMDSSAFIREVIWKRIGVSHVLIGYDHHFGKDRSGDVDTVTRIGRELGFGTTVFPKTDVEGMEVSSTKIRTLLKSHGDVERAAALLGRPYRISGTVVRGDGRGRELGFPTANIRLSNPRKLIPAHGVYAVIVNIEGERIEGMMNIGCRPTFDGTVSTLEVHLMDRRMELYGRDLSIDLIGRLRDERRFESRDELVRQLEKDRLEALARLTGTADYD